LVSLARLAYAANWQLTRRWLRGPAGRGIGRPELPEIGRPRFLSAVARLPAEVGQSLVAATQPLLGTGSRHYAYPASTIHLTLLSLADASGVEGQLQEIAGRHPPFTVDVGGLNASTRTVFAELYPRGGELAALRRDLGEALMPLHAPLSRWLRQRLAHANVLRFAAPVGASLIQEVAKLRSRDFGRFEVAEVELVRTDKVLSADGTRVLGRFPLQGTGSTVRPSPADYPG
jgi:2'-5' RNA ligase